MSKPAPFASPCLPPCAQGAPLGLSWPLLVGLVCTVLPLALLSFSTLEDPDTAMHLAIGEWIFQHGRIPTTDPFSYTLQGSPWIAHEWLAECVMAVFNRVAGWHGLALMALLCLGGTLAYLLRFMLQRMPPIYALLFTALAAAPLATHLLARPHVLTWPLLAWWLGQLVQANEQERAPPWWLAGLMVLWANLHGSFTLGLALVPAMALDALFSRAPGRRQAVWRQWLPFFALTLLAAMATPSGWRGIWFTFHLIDLKYLHYISEWQPASGLNFWPLELWVAALLGLGALGLLRLPPLAAALDRGAAAPGVLGRSLHLHLRLARAPVAGHRLRPALPGTAGPAPGAGPAGQRLGDRPPLRTPGAAGTPPDRGPGTRQRRPGRSPHWLR